MGSTMTRNPAERAVRAELRRLKTVHRTRLGEPSVVPQLERLASLTVMFKDLDAAIRAAGGVNDRTASMAAECTKLADTILETEAYLRGALDEIDLDEVDLKRTRQ